MLKWKNVNFKDNLIYVENQLKKESEGEKYKFKIEAPKSKYGIRTIPLTKRLKKELEQYYKENRSFKNKEYVFVQKHGELIDPLQITKWFAKIFKHLELDGKVSFHTTRHTFASNLIRYSKVDPVTLCKLMGHYSPAFTLKIYAHEFNDVQHEVIKKYEDMISF